MKAIILAAGRGSRLGKHTEQRPKCLAKVGGCPLLEWQIKALYNGSISGIHLIGGYLADLLAPFGLPLLTNPRWKYTNMVGTLFCADSLLLRENFLISYSDILYPPSVVQSLISSHGDIVISYDPNWLHLWKMRFTNPLADAETFAINDNGVVTDIGGKTENTALIRGQYMGLVKMTPQGWQAVRAHLLSLPAREFDRLDMTGLLKQLLAIGIDIHTVALDGDWFEIDNENDLRLCNELYAKDLLNLTCSKQHKQKT